MSAILAGAVEANDVRSPSGRQSNLDLISSSARMMRTLLDDLLDMSKIEAGRMGVEVTLRPAPADAGDRAVLGTGGPARRAGLPPGGRSPPAGLGGGRPHPHPPDPQQPALQRAEVHRKRVHHPAHGRQPQADGSAA
uniref:Signal transduction histidine kinase dimerisation/phosphoacceptor domain-containing protein n=1 Tax=Phenylobacterium glaciei TaxID=2803784 RepID=A0A974P790_9CAUL|nr:hypothetical protein JKL49_04575 [Phenylobacterium glaciei]